MSRKYPFITAKHLGEFNQELRSQTKGFLTKFIYNKYRNSDDLRNILKNIIGDIWKELRKTYDKDVWNVVRFYLKGGTAIIETLQYYIQITKNDQLSAYLKNIIDLDLFRGQQSDWDTTIYINPALKKDKFYSVQSQLADIVFKVYIKYVIDLSEFFNSERDNLRVVLNRSQFNEFIISPTIQTIQGELDAAIAIKDEQSVKDLTSKLSSFTKSKNKFLKHISEITYDLTTNTSYMIQPNIKKLGSQYKFLVNEHEQAYSEHLFNRWKQMFGCTQRLPWMKDFTKYVTSKYGPVLLSINRTIMNQRVDSLQKTSKHHFDLFRFMLCYSGKITWNKSKKVEEDLGFKFPYYFFDYQAELIDISTLNYHSHENNQDHWNSAALSNMIPFEGINIPSWRKYPKTPFPVSNFMFAMHDLIVTLKDKGKLQKRCKRLFIMFNIICAMNRQIDLENQFHFQSILKANWSEKEITECQEGLKDLQGVIYNESNIAMRTLLTDPNLTSSTCSAIFPQLKMPDCDIAGKKYSSDKLVEYIHKYVEGVIEVTSLRQIPSQNLCAIMETIHREIPDYQMQKAVAIDVVTKLRNYNLENLSLGDWQTINSQYIMLPYYKRKFEAIITRLGISMYDSTFIKIFKNINKLLPNNSLYIGPVVNRGTMVYKTLGNNTNDFNEFITRNNITVNGFYKYGMEFDLWSVKKSTHTDNLLKAIENLVLSDAEDINKLAQANGMALISPVKDEENIRKHWQFLSPGLFEKTSTILSINNGTVVSKSVSKARTAVVVSIYIRQRYYQKGKTIVVPHIVPIIKINIMRGSAGYNVPELISNKAYLGQDLIYYKSYLETIKINIRNKIDNYPPNTSPILKAEDIYVLSRFYCGYYSFLQSYKRLARSLSIEYNEKSVVDVCAFASDTDNFKNTDKAENFYRILDKAMPTADRLTDEVLNIGGEGSTFSSVAVPERGPVAVPERGPVSVPERIERKKKRPPQPTMEDEEKRWEDNQLKYEETLKNKRRLVRRFLFEKCERDNQCESGCCTYNRKALKRLYDRQLNILKKRHPGGLTPDQMIAFNTAFEKEHEYKQCSPPEFCGK